MKHEQIDPWALQRQDVDDEKAKLAQQPPRVVLRAEPEKGRITIDSETKLEGIPSAAWNYRLGNRSAIEWVLEQFKESKSRDKTIQKLFSSYRFSDHKESLVDLVGRVVRVSVETEEIRSQMAAENPD